MDVSGKMLAFQLLPPAGLDELRGHEFADSELRLLAEYHHFVFLKSGNNFYLRLSLKTERDGALLDVICAVHHKPRAGTFLRRLHHLNQKSKNVRGGVQRNQYGRIHSRHQFILGIWNVNFGEHGARLLVDLIGKSDNGSLKSLWRIC